MLINLCLLFLASCWTASVEGTIQPLEYADYDFEVDVEVEDTLAHTVNVVAPPTYHDDVYVNIKPNSVVGFVQTPNTRKFTLSKNSNDFNVEVDKSNIHTLKVVLQEEEGDETGATVGAPEIEAKQDAEVEKLPEDAHLKSSPAESDFAIDEAQFLPKDPLNIKLPAVPYPSLPVFTPPVFPMFNPPDYNEYFKAITSHTQDLSKDMENVDPSAYVLNFYLGF